MSQPSPASPLLGLPQSDPNRLNKELRASTCDGAAYGFMVGVAESYFALFALAVGLGEVFSGIISSVPMTIGAVLQLVSPFAIRRIQSHRRWVLICASVQTCCFLPLVIAACSGQIGRWEMLAIISLYWGTCLGTSPAWNTWQGTLVPRSMRAKYYGKRSRLAQATTLAGFLLAGFLLQYGKKIEQPVGIFVILFSLGFIFRGISTGCLWMQSEPVPIPPRMRPFRFWEQAHLLLFGKAGRLLLFAISMQCAVYISAPLFTPYMREKLEMDYVSYVTVLAVSFVAKSLTLPVWGKLAHRHGAHRVLWWSAIAAIPLAAAWCVSDRMDWLILVQVAAGAAWGAYELALMLLFFETIPEEERTNALTLYNLANNFAVLVGSTIGTGILVLCEVSVMGYFWAFCMSSLGRAVAVLVLMTVPVMQLARKPSPQTSSTGDDSFTLHPAVGLNDQPVLSSLPDQTLPDAEVARPPDSAPENREPSAA